jgi:23S rRNA (uracil1939-C5)-methyltransferase
VGFFARRSHQLVDVERCIALDPRLDAALGIAGRALRGLLRTDDSLRGTVVPSGAVQLALQVTGSVGSRVGELAKEWVHDGVASGVTWRVGNAAPQIFGEALLDDGEPGAPHYVSAAGFRQANHEQNAVLRRLVLDALDAEGQSLLELYAGDGNFTRDAAGRATRVVAIEEDHDAIARLRRSLPTVEAIAGRVEHELERRGTDRFTRVLLDPPRAGAKDAIPALLRLRAERIVYVSCDLMTLSRDLRLLTDGGYIAEWVTPVDLMPHTDHVECVVKLSRSAG